MYSFFLQNLQKSLNNICFNTHTHNFCSAEDQTQFFYIAQPVIYNWATSQHQKKDLLFEEWELSRNSQDLRFPPAIINQPGM